jgi:hypothetical protein
MKKSTLFATVVCSFLLGLAIPSGISVLADHDNARNEDTFSPTPLVQPERLNIETLPACEAVQHFHYFRNISENPPGEEFRAVVYAFAVELSDEFWDYADTETMQCSTGAETLTWTNTCRFDKNTVSEGDILFENSERGGTKLTYDRLDWVPGRPHGLIWEYGQDALGPGGSYDDPTDLLTMPWLDPPGHDLPDEFKREALWFELEPGLEDLFVETSSWTKVEMFLNDESDDTGVPEDDILGYTNVYPIDVDFDQNGTDDIGVDHDGDFIFWHGLNGTERTIWPVCTTPPDPDPDPIECANLEWDIDSIDVDTLFENIHLTATVTDTTGADISNDPDLDFLYEAWQFGSDYDDVPDATGTFNRGGASLTRSNNEVNYKNPQPGDKIRVQVVGAEDVCFDTLEFPYCQNTHFTRPLGSTVSTSSDTFEIDLLIEATASDGSNWPYDLIYDSLDAASTFDGENPSITTTDKSLAYSSEESSTVSVEAVHDVAGVCSDQFTYTVMPPPEFPVCDELNITSYGSTIPLEDIQDGDVEITWETFMDDGTDSEGPWSVTSSNPNGEFRSSPAGSVIATGTLSGTTLTTVYYTGEPGDSLIVQEDTAPVVCRDQLDSETPPDEDDPYCEDLTITSGPDETDGTPLDISTNEGRRDLYDESTVCFDYEIEVSEDDWDGTLQITGLEDDSRSAGTTGILNIVGESTHDNPVTLPLEVGQTTYTGTVCYENFDEENVLDFEVIGESACQADFEFPTFEPEVDEPVCRDLEMDPNNEWTIDPEDRDSGLIEFEVDIDSDYDWEGTLVIEPEGSCKLTYAEGGAPFFGDGRLEFPVNHNMDRVEFNADECEDNDEIKAYIRGEDDVCYDDIEFFQDEEPEYECENLDIIPQGSYTFKGYQSRPLDLEIEIEAEDRDWKGTLIVEASGTCELTGPRGLPGQDELEIDVDGRETTIEISVDNCRDDDHIEAYIRGESRACSDDLEFETEPVKPPEYCTDPLLNFDPTTPTILIEGGDINTNIDLECDCLEPGRTVVVTYTGCDGTIGYQGASYDGRLEIYNATGEDLRDVSFDNVCENATIEAYVDGYQHMCYDQLHPEVLKLGEFEKSIFTFNFAADKNSYSDEDTFFSHDEDRAFYTLEYDPTGDEYGIAFTDNMWQGSLEGFLGTGEASGGKIQLATSKQQLIEGEAAGQVYNYNSLVNFGFGSNGYGGVYEAYTQDIATEVQARYDSEFTSFIPYIKYNFSAGRQSELIPECTLSGDRVVSTQPCFNPLHSPERTGDVRIENAGAVEALGDGASIRIRYVGIVEAGLNCSSNTDGCLTEEFENRAEVYVYENVPPLQDSARLVSLCSYLVTRAGDVYLGGDLQAGSDVSCVFDQGEFRSVDGVVIKEGDVSEASQDFIAVEQIDLDDLNFCDDEATDDVFGSLSSYVCEIVLEVSDLWKEATVAGSTAGQVSQATRNAETNPAGLTTFSTWDELYGALHNPNNPDSGILYFDGSKDGNVLTLGGITIPSGAWTLIVENADLNIVEDLQYASTTDYSNIPSAAFLVLGGDIFIQNTAEDLVGVYYTDQSFTGNDRSPVNEPLEILGSVYGNVQPLLDAAKYVGPPTLDGGGIVVRYDSRIILNTPPALSEYVDVQTEQAVN